MKSESGFAVAWVVVILMVVGIVIAAVFQLAPISLRAAVREQQSVQALAHAESGIVYALTWFESEDFDPDLLTDEKPYTIVENREIGDGGFRNLSVTSGVNSEYIIASIGYQARSGTKEVTRTVETEVRLTTSEASGIFPRHWVDINKLALKEGEEGYDPSYDREGFSYEPIEPDWPAWDNAPADLPPCGDPSPGPRDIVGKTSGCEWDHDADYALNYWPATTGKIENSTVVIGGNIVSSNGQVLTVSDSTLFIGGDFRLRGTTTFHNTKIYIDGTIDLEYEDADITFSGTTEVFVKEDLKLGGGARMKFKDNAKFRVDGNVIMNQGGWASTTGQGSEPPWVTFYVQKGVNITGGADAGFTGNGQNIPDVAFLLSMDPNYTDGVWIGGNNFVGGVYAPTRDVYVDYTTVWGSLVAKNLRMPAWQVANQPDFRERFKKREERLKSFPIGTSSGGVQKIERMPVWREVRSP